MAKVDGWAIAGKAVVLSMGNGRRIKVCCQNGVKR